MRWLVLYLRSRQVLVSVGTALACVVGLGVLTGESEGVRLVMAVFAATAVTAVTATGLAGPDPALERTAALTWWTRRAAHVVAIGVLAVVLGVVLGPPVATEVVVRDAVGLTGLAALGATVLGGALAWCLPMTWTVVASGALLAGDPVVAPPLTWLVQPPGTTAAMVAAVVMGVAGLLVYAVRGPRAQR
ncbi:hypothetical protein [Actinophytocola sp.]|uniref:hypothetical protein n=1 Tax=Actinophytocola sp. TaxID=1872138 RepID=UPI00389B14FA